MGWVRKKMMNPKGDIGKVVDDNNTGIFRILTIEFDDGLSEELWLSNVCENPLNSQDWKWEYEHQDTKVKEWVRWGK